VGGIVGSSFDRADGFRIAFPGHPQESLTAATDWVIDAGWAGYGQGEFKGWRERG
jgi:hypothetical protein